MHELKQEKEASIQYGYDVVNDNVVVSQRRGQLLYIDADYIKRFAYGLLVVAEEIEIIKQRLKRSKNE